MATKHAQEGKGKTAAILGLLQEGKGTFPSMEVSAHKRMGNESLVISSEKGVSLETSRVDFSNEMTIFRTWEDV